MEWNIEENNTRIIALHESIVNAETKRRHFSINNKHAVGIIRNTGEILIYDYERSIRPLARVKQQGSVVLLRLGTKPSVVIEVLESLERVIKAIIDTINAQPKPKNKEPVKAITVVDPSSTAPLVGRIVLDGSGKCVISLKTTEYKVKGS